MRFVHEQVVDAHLFEINHVIRPPLDGILQFFKFRLKILLPLFQSAYNPAADLVSLLLEYGKVLLYAFYLLIVYLLLYLRWLGDFSELVVREYDAVPVVVFDVMEYPDTFFGGEILLSRIQYLRVRICPFECVGDVVHVALQPYNHGLVRQSETLHLEGGHTHDERLAGATG